ncbi:hypothetical protein LXA43DRAFT_881570 [Ganoderma leucocontextum]|nr:hypothetical protein LXA43DRAFT_881570 [Ganoderma leucocontextum]
MDSPRLPWEVIERVIGHSCDHQNTLGSLSLTCRQLRPRALCLMVAHVELKSRDRIFDFCAVLQAKPHLKPLVRSTVVDPTDFAPVPLLRILPNLSEIRFTSKKTVIAIHQSNLTCFRHYGIHIQTLHLSNLSFATYLPLARVLLAFTNLVHLTCTDIKITTSGKQLAQLGMLKQRLSQRLRLKSLASRSSLIVHALIHPAADCTMHIHLVGRSPDARWHSLARRSDWSRLRTLVLQFPSGYGGLYWAVDDLLESVHGPALKEVILALGPVSSLNDPATFRDPKMAGVYEKLEHSLLRFSQPGIIWTMKNPLHADRNSFWTRELGRPFPVLSQRGVLMLKSETGTVIHGTC